MLDGCLFQVYQYLPNGSLEDRLARHQGTPPLSANMRLKIVKGTANGIQYLNDNGYVHRDIKSANILLDSEFTAKVSSPFVFLLFFYLLLLFFGLTEEEYGTNFTLVCVCVHASAYDVCVWVCSCVLELCLILILCRIHSCVIILMCLQFLLYHDSLKLLLLPKSFTLVSSWPVYDQQQLLVCHDKSHNAKHCWQTSAWKFIQTFVMAIGTIDPNYCQLP